MAKGGKQEVVRRNLGLKLHILYPLLPCKTNPVMDIIYRLYFQPGHKVEHDHKTMQCGNMISNHVTYLNETIN